MYRTHTCGELTKNDVKKEVHLSGWNHSRRDHGGIIFIDLRDRYGITQIVFDPKHNKQVHAEAEHLKREDVIKIKGKVRLRGKGLENPKLKTGQIEVLVYELEILNRADTPPIEIDDRIEANEETRLKYRYLDLRRPVMQHRLLIRHKTVQAAREYLNKNNFLEIETPILVRATPEGARDYIVPSRVNPGKFYALPQSPQLYKQILMASGCDRYYQIARCLRDEDLRADRQPEHTQIDIEMSFVDEDDVMSMVEGLHKYLMKKVINKEIKYKFPRLTYKEAMDKYGTDKPDTRFELELINVTDIVKNSDFEVFKNMDMVKCINPNAHFSRKEIDELINFAQQNGAKGMAWIKITDKGMESSIIKYFNRDIQKKLLEKTKAKKGSILFFVADKEKTVNEVLGRVRLELGKKLKLINKDEFNFLWVTDFPLFEWNEDEERFEPCHHIFTSPKQEHLQYLEKDPSKVHAKLYDLILNGVELGSGSIRINNKDIQQRVMKAIGLSEEKAMHKFGFLLNAFKYGTPPHGGMGLGLDRIVALMLGLNDIREVIAFPKNKKAECPMDGSPSDVPKEQLKELHIRVEGIRKGERKKSVFERIKDL
jgi:aspartyl-tRNA synthetase